VSFPSRRTRYFRYAGFVTRLMPGGELEQGEPATTGAHRTLAPLPRKLRPRARAQGLAA
jgi:hypothetical protein